MASKIPEIFYAFGPQLNAFISVGTFSSSVVPVRVKTVPNLGMSFFISLTKLSSAATFTRTSHYSTLNFTYEED